MRRASSIATAGLLTVVLGYGTSMQPRIGDLRTPATLGHGGDGGPSIGRPTIEAGRMVGERRTVCRSDGRPRGWVNEPTPSSDANDNCPGGGSTGAATRRIRRLP